MLRIFFLLVLLQHGVITVFSQARVTYGNNPNAGKYHSIRGFKMYTEEYGNGKPLLLIHGNGGSMNSFSSTIGYFAARYHVIATDSRAHGKSIDLSDSLSFEMMADDEAALLDEMNIDSALVIGWSDGGIVALVLAMRHPEKVSKLACTGANLWPDSTALIPSFWKDEKIYFDSLQHTTRITSKEKNDWKIFMLDWLQPNILLNALQKIHCPSLIIGGDHDLITIEHTVQIYKALPHAYLWIVPDSGHATLIEHKEEFNTNVDKFFNKAFHYRQ